MTQQIPPPTPELDAPALISTGAEAIIQNAPRLGLTWDLLLATVQYGDDPNNVAVICDGDTANLTAVSMIGPCISAERVYVIKVPPSGLFIVGRNTGAGTFVYPLIQSANATSLESTSSTSFVDLPGGPAVTAVIGLSGSAFVILGAELLANFTAFSCIMSYQVTGASSVAPSDTLRGLSLTNHESGAGLNTLGRVSSVIFHTGLNPGLNTFGAKYRARTGGGQIAVSARNITVIPL